MKNLVFPLAAFILSVSTACHIACIDGHGPVHVQQRDAGTFAGVRLSVPAEVTIRNGSPATVEVEAEDNLLKEITTAVRGGVLRIGSERCIDPNLPVRIRISAPDLEELEINGSGKILVPDTFQVEHIDLAVNGSGDIKGSFVAARIRSVIRGSGDMVLRGSANDHEITIHGSGDVDAAALPCNSTAVKVNGSGDVFVYAIKDLDVRVNGSGNVHYKGKPSVSTRVNGSGKVVDEN